MQDRYENFTFFRQRIVSKQNTEVIQGEEYELLLRSKRGETYVFPEKEFGEAMVDRLEHKQYLKKIEYLLERVLQKNSGIYSINIDPQELYYEETFLLFEHFKNKNQRLKIELTEHSPYIKAGDYYNAFPLEPMIRLHELGFEIVLDDFLSGINGIDRLIALSPFISRVKISKLIFKKKVSDSAVCSFIYEIYKLIQEINPNLSLVIEAEESEEMLKKLSDTWYYQTYYFDKPSKVN
ncbi:EAL domain-containing protein [Lactococcus lactis]|uniref:EAL domain-containing protein n=1 Tax=Lactococcus lactis TaxID=1358 RepID=UPI003877A4D4